MSSASPDRASLVNNQGTRFAKACERCRQQKLACKPGSRGDYPCLRCEDTKSKCVLVERTRPTPVPTLSSKLSRQEESLGSLSSQIQEMQRKLSILTDVQLRLASLETKFRTLESSNTTPGHQQDYMSTSTHTHAMDPIRGVSLSDHRGIKEPDHVEEVAVTGAQEHTVNDDIAVVQNFENADINVARLLSDARLYRKNQSRLGKRMRIEDEADSLRVAFTIFTVRCLPAVNFYDHTDPTFTAENVQKRSQLFYWSIITIGAREIPELYDLYVKALEKTMALLRLTLGGKKPSYWDVCGAMVWNKWLAPIRPIGHIVDLGYELDIHRTYDLMRDRNNPSPDEVARIRLWISILVMDYFYSSATGRPPHYPHRDRALVQAKWLVTTRWSVRNDYRLISTYEYEEITHEIQEEAGRSAALTEGWEDLVERKITALNEWYARWEPLAAGKSEPGELVPLLGAVRISWYTAKLAVYSVVLRGIRSVQDLTTARLTYVALSVATAREECQMCVNEFQPPAIQYMGESQLYAFVSAVVFLLKVIWLLPNMEEAPQIFAELESVITVMEAISGQMHAHFLSQILRHVKGKVDRTQNNKPTTLSAGGEGVVGDKDRPKLDGFSNPASMVNIHDFPITDFSTSDPTVPGPDLGVGLIGSGLGDLLDIGQSTDDFWSWLQVDGPSFSPLVDTLDTFDSNIPMGGL